MTNLENEARRIYTDNTPNAVAVKGLTSKLERYFGRHGIPLSRQIIERHCGEFKQEFGASFISKTRTLIYALREIGYNCRAEYLCRSFAIVTDKTRRKFALGDWLERAFGLLGEMAAQGLARNFSQLELKKFEMLQLMAAEVV